MNRCLPQSLSLPFVWIILAALSLQCWPARAADSLLVASPRDQAAAQRIRAALSETISCDFRDRPLSQFAQALGRRLGISVVLDTRNLRDANPAVSPDTLITVERQDASAESVLAALKDLNVTWIISDEALVLTSRDEADKHLFVKVYPIRDLLDKDNSAEGLYDCDPMIQLIQSVIGPPTVWRDVNPDGGTMEFHEPTGTLVITQTREVHDQIELLLAALRKVRNPQAIRAETTATTARTSDTVAAVPPPTRHYAATQSWNVPQLHH